MFKKVQFCVNLICLLAIAASAVAASDDYKTIGLWHMDTSFIASDRLYVPDDDSFNSSRDHHLLLGRPDDETGATEPAIVAGGYDDTGSALRFDGIDDMAYGVSMLDGLDSFEFECWIKLDPQTPSYPLFSLFYLWGLNGGDEIRIEGTYGTAPNQTTRIKFYHANIGYGNCWIPLTYDNQWHYVYAYIDSTTQILQLDDTVTQTDITGTPFEVRTGSRDILIGSTGGRSWIDGLIDEVKISLPTTPQPVCGDWGYLKADVNKDCFVNLADLADLVRQWKM